MSGPHFIEKNFLEIVFLYKPFLFIRALTEYLSAF
jgi:hypothetical protein